MTSRIQLSILVLAGLIAGALAVHAVALIGSAHASTLVDAGVAPVVTPLSPAAPVASVAPAIHDPVNSPSEAFDELKAARRIGWPVTTLVGLTMLLLVVGRYIPALSKGTTAFVVACLTTGCLAAGNAMLGGGAWSAAALAGVLASFGLWQADRTKAAADKAAKASG